jgi:serine/threonine-protein kinase
MSSPEKEEKTAPPSAPSEEAPTVVRPASAPPGEEATWVASSSRPDEGFTVPAPGHIVAGRYMVFEQLGQGGMGVVLAAYDSRLERRVALKLLRPQEASGSSASDGEARLAREAQAMARLNHPHVVAVYDSGTLEDGALFIAMEYVEGATLRRWCEQQPRSWREVLQAYLAAGRGLAAAHAAGLIHRDFKPDNVLVGNDGRVRVTDFGLARANSGPSLPDQPPASPTPETWSHELTLPGTLMGTPRYMAPEQVQGAAANVRTDLYAFCVSLYEALYRQLPFPEASMAEYFRARREGRVTPPPAQSEVPTWVARTVLQGLQADPLQRPASMEALLAALQDDPEVKRQARRRSLAVASVGLVLAGLAIWGWARQHAQEPVCGRVERRLDGIWDATVKERVRGALLGTGLPYAQDTAERVSSALDGYARRWVQQSTELCEAGQAARLPRLAVLRESCLERRRSRLRATTELLAREADPELLKKAAQSAQSLPPLEDCADDEALTAAVPPPEDPTVRAQVEALQEQVDRVEALNEAGKYKEGLAAGEALLPQVEPVGHAPLHARLLLLLGRLKEALGDYKGSEALARQALDVSSRGRDLVVMSRAMSLLAEVVGQRQQRLKEAAPLEPVIQALAESTGDELTQAVAFNNLGALYIMQGKYPEAGDAFSRSVALREKVLGPEHPLVAASRNNLAIATWWMGKYEDASREAERALSIQEKALGPEHPEVLGTLANAAIMLDELGRYDEGLKRYERALRLQEKVQGPEHPDVARVLGNMAITLNIVGRYEEARQHIERAIALAEKLHGPEHPEVGNLRNTLGSTLASLERYTEALDQYARALTLREKTLGPAHMLVAESLRHQGEVLTKLGRYREARERLQRSLAVHEKALGQGHPDLAYGLVAQGKLLLAQGKTAEALVPLEQALKLSPEGFIRADVQFTLARALWEAKSTERSRAVALATQARDFFQRRNMATELAETSKWLATHTSP